MEQLNPDLYLDVEIKISNLREIKENQFSHLLFLLFILL